MLKMFFNLLLLKATPEPVPGDQLLWNRNPEQPSESLEPWIRRK